MECNALLGTMPDVRLAEMCGLSPSKVWRLRTDAGIPAFARNLRIPRRRYDINAFDSIDRISAYWLGYYFADGCICPTTQKRRIIALSTCDFDVIEKLCAFYDADVSLVRSRIIPESGRISYSLHLCNDHLFNSLHELGCVPNKSNILDKPNIGEEFYPSFLLGFYDGDGSISLNRTINSWKVSIGTGGFGMFSWMCAIIADRKLRYSTEIRHRKNTFYIICLCGLEAKRFLDLLYAAVPEHLPMVRKKKDTTILQQAFRPG